jgi:hypothetical protein
MPPQSLVQPFLVIGFWVLFILVASCTLRWICEFFAEDPPTPRRALFMSVVVAAAVFFTLEYSSYLILLAISDTAVAIPPGYGFWNWVYEPIGLKWAVLGKVPFVRYLPILFAVCVAGAVQCILLELKVNFRRSTFYFVTQWLFAAAIMAAVTTGVNLLLARLPAAPAGGPAAARPGVRPDPHGQDMTVAQFWGKFQEVVDPYLGEVKEALEPFIQLLPEGVRRVLDGGGWLVILVLAALLALFWTRRALQAVRKFFRRRRRKKKRPTYVSVDLHEDLNGLETVYNEEGDSRVLVKGVPARVRLVVLSQGVKGGQRMTEEMTDTLLDWVCPGLGDAAGADYPRVRLWPLYPSPGGFDLAFAQNVRPPGPRGQRSPWVLVSGRVQVGSEKINVGLALVTDSPTALGHLKGHAQWHDVLSVSKAPVPARA